MYMDLSLFSYGVQCWCENRRLVSLWHERCWCRPGPSCNCLSLMAQSAVCLAILRAKAGYWESRIDKPLLDSRGCPLPGIYCWREHPRIDGKGFLVRGQHCSFHPGRPKNGTQSCWNNNPCIGGALYCVLTHSHISCPKTYIAHACMCIRTYVGAYRLYKYIYIYMHMCVVRCVLPVSLVQRADKHDIYTNNCLSCFRVRTPHHVSMFRKSCERNFAKVYHVVKPQDDIWTIGSIIWRLRKENPASGSPVKGRHAKASYRLIGQGEAD